MESTSVKVGNQPPVATDSPNRRRKPDLTKPMPQRVPSLAVPLPPSAVPLPSGTPPLNFSSLERLNRIGSGNGSTVYKVIHRLTGKIYALKVIYGNYKDTVRNQIRREIEILRDVDHLNVVKCHDMLDHNGEIQVLLEYMDGGSLEGTHIHHEPSLADLSRQILSGLCYLHRRKIVHRDIKPSNLLINSRKQVKIADFGLSRILAETMDPNCNSSVGTIAYMSPERIDTDINQGKYNGYAVDIWSFGVSILEFYLGRFPFAVGRQGDWASLMCAICLSQSPEPPPTASKELRDFIACCLQRDPSKRWTAPQLLNHPFVTHNMSANQVPPQAHQVESHGTILSPEDKESLPRETNEVSHSFEEELLEEIWSEDLEKTPSDPRELEALKCEPMEVPPTISDPLSILQVLDLSYTEIKSLPQSISQLIALQKLSLRGCELLMELPPEIGELTNLEVLDLEGTEIMCLPEEIAKLVNLTCLKVSFDGYANQTAIPRGVLSSLSHLNELIIDVTPYGGWWDVEVEAIIDDLCSLKELRTLKLYFPTAEVLEHLTVIFPGLANFRFTVGRHKEHFISRLPHAIEEEFNNREKLVKGLKYVNGNRIPNEITKVFKHADAFFLQRHWTAETLSEFGHENMNDVKFCLVMDCNEIRSVIDSEQFYQGTDGRSESNDFQDFDETIVLGSLEKLIIRYMKNMESIWKGPVGKGSLSNLKSLALHTCPNLTTLFTIDMLSNLINLEELIVEDCQKIDSLVSIKSSDSKPGVFLASLKKISLLGLPELASISSGLLIAPKLERMVIFYCPKLEKLSTMEVSSTDLKVIKGETEWWDALKWYESDLSTEHEDYLARLFIPLRRDGDLMAQITKD